MFKVIIKERIKIYKLINYRKIHSREVRQIFIEYFQKENNHVHLPSSSIRAINDPTLLFTNAGMNQFKSIFLNTIDPNTKLASIKRAVTCQKCVRVRGKHNDLEDVGHDTTHHTFFEMLGSWSFGDYFKEKACQMAWALLTERYQLPSDRLYVTYFAGDERLGLLPDFETRDIWKKLSIPDNKIIPCGVKDNFWEMGENGPCGPCTEIHYDYIGDRDASSLVNTDHQDVVELWNLVFMKYNKTAENVLQDLPIQHVDTGMGLERLTAILQGKRSNYDTDLFLPIMDNIHNICGCPKYSEVVNNDVNIAYRIITDHMRMLIIAISDDVTPANISAGLLVRQIFRRAFSQVNKLCGPDNLLSMLVPSTIKTLQDAYPELHAKKEFISQIIKEEEKHYNHIIDKCNRLIHQTLIDFDSCRIDFPVETAIKLCNQHGLPRSVLLEELKNHELVFDLQEFKRIEEQEELLKELGRQKKQKYKVKSTINITPDLINELKKYKIPITQDQYKYSEIEDLNPCHANVLAVADENGNLLTETIDICPDYMYGIILDKTNMFSLDSGQLSDTGEIIFNSINMFKVASVNSASGYVIHHGKFSNSVKLKEIFTVPCVTEVNCDRRLALSRAHTASHLLNFAIREIYGDSVHQKSLKIKPDELTYHCNTCCTANEMLQVENIVQNFIKLNHNVERGKFSSNKVKEYPGVRYLNYATYPDISNLITIGGTELEKAKSFSAELCGGTHVKTTNDIEDFVITKIRNRGVNLRSLKCYTGPFAKNSRYTANKLKEELEIFIAESKSCLENSSYALKDVTACKDVIGSWYKTIDEEYIPVHIRGQLKKQLRSLSKRLIKNEMKKSNNKKLT